MAIAGTISLEKINKKISNIISKNIKGINPA